MGCLCFCIVSIFSFLYVSSKSHDDHNTEYGIIILKDSVSADYICYVRKKLYDDEKNLIDNLEIMIGAFSDYLVPEASLRQTIENCGWDNSHVHSVIVQYVFSLEFTYDYTDEEFDLLLEYFTQQINPIKNFQILLNPPIKMNHKSSGLIDLLRVNYDFSKSHFKTNPVMVFSAFKFSVGIPTSNPDLYDGDILKEFSLRNQKYTAVAYNFFCLGFYKIMYSTYHQLYENEIKSKEKEEIDRIYHPCVRTEMLELIESQKIYDDSCILNKHNEFDLYFEGKFNFDECAALINGVIHEKEFCENNHYCNFSNLKKGTFFKESNHIQFFNSHFNFEKEKKDTFLRKLHQYAISFCNEGVKQELEHIVQVNFIQCFTLLISHTLLSDPLFLDDETELSFKKMSSDDAENEYADKDDNANKDDDDDDDDEYGEEGYVYIFFDSLFGSIVEGEEKLAIIEPAVKDEIRTPKSRLSSSMSIANVPSSSSSSSSSSMSITRSDIELKAKVSSTTTSTTTEKEIFVPPIKYTETQINAKDAYRKNLSYKITTFALIPVVLGFGYILFYISNQFRNNTPQRLSDYL